jgi:hypothetical protein
MVRPKTTLALIRDAFKTPGARHERPALYSSAMSGHSWFKWAGVSGAVSAAFFALAAYLQVREVTDWIADSSAWLGILALLLTLFFAFLAATFGWRKRRGEARETRQDLRRRLIRRAEVVEQHHEEWERGDFEASPQRGLIIRRAGETPFDRFRERYKERHLCRWRRESSWSRRFTANCERISVLSPIELRAHAVPGAPLV